MRKSAYFIIQALWSLFFATIVWFGFMGTASVNGDNHLAVGILLGGAFLYFLLTVAYIVLGWKKVSNFRALMIVIAVAVNIFMLTLGFLCASSLSALLLK